MAAVSDVSSTSIPLNTPGLVRLTAETIRNYKMHFVVFYEPNDKSYYFPDEKPFRIQVGDQSLPCAYIEKTTRIGEESFLPVHLIRYQAGAGKMNHVHFVTDIELKEHPIFVQKMDHQKIRDIWTRIHQLDEQKEPPIVMGYNDFGSMIVPDGFDSGPLNDISPKL